MQDGAGRVIVTRIIQTHAWLIQATESIDESDFCRRFSATAPPIGWHLWHVARWADRVQASCPQENGPEGYQPNPNNGIWEQELLATEWELDSSKLGMLETGIGMNHEDAAALPVKVGKAKIINYAKRAFAQLDDILQSFNAIQLGHARRSVMEFEVCNGQLHKAQGKDTTLVADLGFHLSHISRHLGMIEALSGLPDKDGTISV